MRRPRHATSSSTSCDSGHARGRLLVVAVLDVVVAWALYAVLRPVSRGIALLAAWLRVVYAAVFAAALSNLVVAARAS